MSPIGGPGRNASLLPQQQNLENSEDFEKKEKDKPTGGSS